MNEDKLKVVNHKVVGAVVVGDRLYRRWSDGSIFFRDLSTGDNRSVILAGDNTDPGGLVWDALLRAAYPMLQAKEDGTIVPIHESLAVLALKEIRDILCGGFPRDEAGAVIVAIRSVVDEALAEAP